MPADLDAFYAAVEPLDSPELRGLPVMWAAGDAGRSGHGVLRCAAVWSVLGDAHGHRRGPTSGRHNPPSPLRQTRALFGAIIPPLTSTERLFHNEPRQVKFALARAIRSFTANWLASKSQTRPFDLPGPPPFPPRRFAGAVSTATGDATILGDAASGPRGHCRSDPKQGLNLAYHPRPWG